MAAPSRFCVFWIRNTIRNVMIVVDVFTTSCHVSENPKNGPVAAQNTMAKQQITKVSGLPAARATELAKRVKVFSMGAPAAGRIWPPF
jgi:hypothetical protein